MATTERLIQDYVRDTEEAYSQWLKEAKSDLDYSLGYQWSREDRETLRQQNQTPLTLNKILPIVNFVSGFERQNKMDIKCIGVEGGDEFVAEVMTLLIKNIMTRNYGEYKISQMFQGGIMSSKGWIELSHAFEDNPLDAEIRLHNGMYFEIFPDPDYREYDMHRDAEFLIKKVRMPKAKIISLYPEKERRIRLAQEKPDPHGATTITRENPATGYSTKTGEGEPGFTRSERTQLSTLIECWWKKYEKRKYTIDFTTGEIKDITDLKLSVREQREMLEMIPVLGILDHRVGIPYVATMLGDVLLQEETISPYYPELKAFPFVPYVAYFSPEGVTPERVCQSVVRALKDPQNEVNKRRTKLLDAIGSAPWIGDVDALDAKGWKDLEKHASSPRLVLKKIKRGTELRRESPVVDGSVYLHLVRQDAESMKEISGINPDLLGMADKTISGRAMAIRQQSGLIVIQSVFDNLRYSRHILGKLIIGMVLKHYTPEKVVRVCGEEMMGKMGVPPLQAAEMVLDAVNMKEYDITIDEVMLSPVMRMAILEELRAMRVEGILPPGIAEDLIIDASNLPNRAEIKARIMQAQQQMVGGGEPQPLTEEPPGFEVRGLDRYGQPTGFKPVEEREPVPPA